VVFRPFFQQIDQQCGVLQVTGSRNVWINMSFNDCDVQFKRSSSELTDKLLLKKIKKKEETVRQWTGRKKLWIYWLPSEN
jgi:hypothetical protein